MHRTLADISKKRKATGGVPPRRRAKTCHANLATFKLNNVAHGEVVHQSCVLLKGTAPCYENSDGDYVTLQSTDCFGATTNVTSWPSGDDWKALTSLQPGLNKVAIVLHHLGGVTDMINVEIVYEPLLQIPPLHLAIMVAKDSPLTMDCPISKFGPISSAHSSLNAAIDKFRATAQMWQALTADQLRQSNLGRRSFRLEEEWSTLGVSIIKVHIVRSERTVKEIQALKGFGEVQRAFVQALAAYGSPFLSSVEPVVAGLVFDAHFSAESGEILGYVEGANSNSCGLSLALFSSHMTCSWPRSLSEIPAALTDTTTLDDSVGTVPGDGCHTLQDACCSSQATFLWDVGQAFGLDDELTMDFAEDWRHFFISSHPKPCPSSSQVWSLNHAYKLKSCPQFKMPGDKLLTKAFRNASIVFKPGFDEEDSEVIKISCPDAHLVAVTITNGNAPVHHDFRRGEEETASLTISNLETYSREAPLHVHVLASNGRTRTVTNAWNHVTDHSVMRIPKTTHSQNVIVSKNGVRDQCLEDWFENCSDPRQDEIDELVPWTVLFQKLSSKGTTVLPAEQITTCVGATFDGAFVRYASGVTAHCGPEYQGAQRFRFGGNQNSCQLTASKYVTKVEVQKQYGNLDGLRITLSDGTIAGNLNDHSHWHRGEVQHESSTVVLEPGPGERIVGFYGRSAKPHRGYTREFGILVASKDDLDKDGFLPRAVHDLACVRTSGRWEGDGGPLEGSISGTGENSIDMVTEDEADDSDWSEDDTEDEHDEGEGSSQVTMV